MKKFYVLFVFLFVPLISVLLLQCTDNPTVFTNDEQTMITEKGKGGGGGGGHTTVLTNNLSFPVFTADGFIITPLANPSFLTAYTGPYTGLTPEELALVKDLIWYAQKVDGNVWQADFEMVSQGQQVDITFVDWGDAIESVDPKIGRPYRLELALYNKLLTPMDAYTMALLAFPSSPNETQGTNGITYSSNYATTTSPNGRLVVQRFEPTGTIEWTGTQWYGDGIGAPITGFGFAPELNVGGKYIFGASTGGWTPTETGNYRITFYMANGSSVNLGNAFIADNIAPETPKIAENQPVVDPTYKISYVDVQATSGGGGGGGH